MKSLTIVNISSGDGELVYLNSSIREEIKSIKNVMQWNSFIESITKLYNKGYLLLLSYILLTIIKE